jgi:predicted N-formylglutamate amidohydrolase
MMLTEQPLLGPDEPGPYEIIRRNGRSELVLVCDHASNRVPAQLNNLGLDQQQLASHIGWDPGAALLARELSARLDAPLVLSNYSRLVIDCNRPPTQADSIPATSAGIGIPGNADISPQQAQARRQTLFEPYQAAISELLDSRGQQKTYFLSIHSFTPSLAGIDRPWTIGVCYRKDVAWAKRWLAGLRESISDPVGDNEPYRVGALTDYAIPVQGEGRGIPSIMLEVRQDTLLNSAAVSKWCEVIAQCWLKTL